MAKNSVTTLNAVDLPHLESKRQVVKPIAPSLEEELARVRDDLSKMRMEFEEFKSAVRKHMDLGMVSAPAEIFQTVTKSGTLPVAPARTCPTIAYSGSQLSDCGAMTRSNSINRPAHGFVKGADHRDIACKGWYYTYGGNVWDVLMFSGMNIFTWSDELIILILGLFNAFIQVTFIQLVMNNMLTEVFTNRNIVQTTKDWRATVAHSTDYVNSFTGATLGQAVCSPGAKGNLMDGVYQANLIHEVRTYLKPFMGSSAGMWMFLVSIFLWTLECAHELGQVLLCFSAAWSNTVSLPTSGWRNLIVEFLSGRSVLLREEAEIRLFGAVKRPLFHACFSKRRASAVTLFIILPRLVIVSYLWFAGVLFIVTTTDLEEMLLNAVALGVILHVDEMIYKVIMPAKSRLLVAQAHPVLCRGFPDLVQRIWPYVETFTLCGLILLVAVVCAWPVSGIMRDVDHFMCQGDKDFAAAKVPSGSVITAPVAAVPVMNRSAHAYRAVLHRTGLEVDPNGRLYMEGSPWEANSMRDLKVYAEFTIEQEAEFRRLCKDDLTATVLPELNYARWDVLKELTGNASVANCTDLQPYCYLRGTTGSVVRMICSETCGGGDPLSGQLFDIAQYGTMPGCRSRIIDELAQMPCQDFTVSELQALPGWGRYGVAITSILREAFQQASRGNLTFREMLEDRVLLGMHSQGCAYFSKPVRIPHTWGISYDFCDPADGLLYGLRTPRMFCPQTCGCSSTDLHDCPLSCR